MTRDVTDLFLFLSPRVSNSSGNGSVAPFTPRVALTPDSSLFQQLLIVATDERIWRCVLLDRAHARMGSVPLRIARSKRCEDDRFTRESRKTAKERQ